MTTESTSPGLIDAENVMPDYFVTGLASGANYDTSWYGGTVWAADSNRWEAIPGGTWTFDSGVASAIQTTPSPTKPIGYHRLMEGWVGVTRGVTESLGFRRESTCAISGSYSMWLGRTLAEAQDRCWPGGQGYPNGVNSTLEQTFAYAGSGDATLQFRFAVEAEPDYDYLMLTVQPSGAGSAVVLATYDGVTAGLANIVLRTVDGTLPAGAGTVTIRFHAYSDGGYSDEDGGYLSTCGLASLDDIQLTGAITHMAGFETGTHGWTITTPTSTAPVDYSHLDDIANLSLPTNFTCNTCGVRDSVLIFTDPSGQHPAGQNNVVASPWIDLKAGGDVGRAELFVTFNAYSGTNTPVTPNLAFGVQYYPWVCPVTGRIQTSPIIYNTAFFFFGNPTCGKVTYSSLRSYAPVGAEQLRVFLGPHGYGELNTSNGPWYDNIRVGTLGPNTAPPLFTNYRLQDNFATDGTLNPSSPSRVDSGLNLSTTTLGDTVVVSAPGNNVEVRVVFRVRPGPFTNLAAMAGRATRWTPEPGLGTGWYSARMDTAQNGQNPPNGGFYLDNWAWMTAFHEADPGFLGTDTMVDATDPGHLANDILPDDLLTPGSRLDYFFTGRYRPPDPRNPGGTSWMVIPDTSDANYYEMEVLPSSMAADTTWNCVLVVDGHERDNRIEHELEESALTLALGSGGTNAEGARFDRWDIQNSFGVSFGRPPGSVAGSTLAQLSAYRRLAWYSGSSSNGGVPRAGDVAILEPWLKAVGAGSRGFWGNGGDFASSFQSGAPRTFLNSVLGVSSTCFSVHAANCPTGSPIDLTGCLPLAAAITPTFLSSGPASLGQHGCPTPQFSNLIAVHASVPTAAGNLAYLKNGTPANFASVTVDTPPGYSYRSVVDAFPVTRLRRTPGDPNDPAQCANLTPVYERTLDVLGWLGTPDCPALATTGVPPNEPGTAPRPFLADPRPNPVTGTTTIGFAVPRSGTATRIDLFDVTGRLVRTLVDKTMDAGAHDIEWDGRGTSGAEVGAGLYFYRMVSGDFVETRKLVVLR